MTSLWMHWVSADLGEQSLQAQNIERFHTKSWSNRKAQEQISPLTLFRGRLNDSVTKPSCECVWEGTTESGLWQVFARLEKDVKGSDSNAGRLWEGMQCAKNESLYLPLEYRYARFLTLISKYENPTLSEYLQAANSEPAVGETRVISLRGCVDKSLRSSTAD